GDVAEMQCVPIDDDLPAANTQKAAKIDYSRAHRPLAVDDDINDASHVFVFRASNVPTEHTMRFACADDRDGCRRRRLLRRGRRRSTLLLLRWRRRCRFAFGPGMRSVKTNKAYDREREQHSGAHLIPSLEERQRNLPPPLIRVQPSLPSRSAGKHDGNLNLAPRLHDL